MDTLLVYHHEWYTICVPNDPHTCPRCLGAVPREGQRGAYPGALSRTDNVTEVCSNCGTMEAISQIGGVLQSQADWPLQGGPTRDLQDILNDPDTNPERPEGPPPFESPQDRAFARSNQATDDAAEAMDRAPFESGVDDLGDGRFLIRRGYEDPDAGPRRSRGEVYNPEYPGYDMNVEGPDYSQPDPFDSSNPEEAEQAQNIADTEEMLSTWDEERDRRRRGLGGRSE